MNNKIYVYSGTGNCYALAKQLSNEIEDTEVIHITDEIASPDTMINANRCIIVAPVYGYGLPATVLRFIKNANFDVKYLAVLVTFGTKPKGAMAQAIRHFAKRGIQVDYTGGSKSVENYVHMFGWPSDEKIKQVTDKQRENTIALAKDIIDRKTNTRMKFRPLSSLFSTIFTAASKVFARRYKFTPACNGCGICHKVCPARAIEMTGEDTKKPVVNARKCDHCQACLQLCPKKAIKFGRIKPDGKRYKHTEVELKELIKR